MNKSHMIAIQLLFLVGVVLGSQDLTAIDKTKWLNVVRYIIYFIIIKSLPQLCNLAYQYHVGLPIDLPSLIEFSKSYAILGVTSAAILVYFEQRLFSEDFIYISAAYLVVDHYKMEEAKSTITYGVGMACSYFEGYLVHVIPSDGVKMVGFEENIRALENKEGVCFPVRKLFIIITKSMFCPPDLTEFNRGDDEPRLQTFTSLEDVIKNVAGVRNRQYRNTAYRVFRRGALPVSVAAECATPLHTLHRVLNNRTLYQEVANIDVEAVTNDFCNTLRSILEKSPQCRGKCELVFFDDEDPTQNLAEIILNRIKELEPNFEEKLMTRMKDNLVDDDISKISDGGCKK